MIYQGYERCSALDRSASRASSRNDQKFGLFVFEDRRENVPRFHTKDDNVLDHQRCEKFHKYRFIDKIS